MSVPARFYGGPMHGKVCVVGDPYTDVFSTMYSNTSLAKMDGVLSPSASVPFKTVVYKADIVDGKVLVNEDGEAVFRFEEAP